jgi:hypothetical protein
MPSSIESATLARIWGFSDGHIPAVHSRGWRELIPTDAEANMMSSTMPVPVWGSCDLPAEFRALKPGDQARCAAYATLGTLALHHPRYNRCIVGGRMVETAGITILVTARDNASIMGVPLSACESYFAAMRRIQDRTAHGHPRLSPSDLTLLHAYLPVWAAVVSMVPQDRPMANLMGSGGACPTEVCVGRKSVNFVSEHRLFTPDDGQRFTDTWMELLAATLAA